MILPDFVGFNSVYTLIKHDVIGVLRSMESYIASNDFFMRHRSFDGRMLFPKPPINFAGLARYKVSDLTLYYFKHTTGRSFRTDFCWFLTPLSLCEIACN